MSRQKIAIYAKMHCYKSNLEKKWFVYFSYRNHLTNKMERFRIYEGFEKLKTIKERIYFGNALVEKINNQIRSGWNPFEEENKKALYNDSLEYQSVSKKYGDLKKTVFDWNYYLSKWIDEKKDNVRLKTYQTYQSKLRLFCSWIKRNKLNEVDINCFTYEAAVKFIKFLNDQHLSGYTKNQYIVLFNTICKNLVDQEKLKKNPFEKLKKYKKDIKHPVPFNDDILIKLKEHLIKNDPQLWIVCQFIFYCFIRPRELRYLKIKDINFLNSTVTIPANISKNHKESPVIIPDHFLMQLKKMDIQNMDPDFYVFTVDQGPGKKPVGQNYMSDHFRRIRKFLDIDRAFKFYAFKHTGGLKLYKSGADLIEMKNQFRHHSLDQMLDYLHMLEGNKSEHIRKNGYIL